MDDYVKAHTPTGVESKLGEQGFTGAAIVELLTAPTTTNAEQLIKEAVPGRPADRLSVLHPRAREAVSGLVRDAYEQRTAAAEARLSQSER